MARVHAVLGEYRRELEALGATRTLLVATSAVRDAGNGADFLGELERDYGVVARLLGGDEEALLTFRGVTSGRELAGETLIVDVGGGSTELLLGGPDGVSFHTSFDAGCVRMTERFLASDPPAPAELAACAAHVRSLLPELDVRAAIGVAGTVTTLAALDLRLAAYDPERIHGHVLTPAAVGRELELLASLPLERRRELPGLEPARAPVIVAGAVIVREVLARYGLEELEASERDILHGAALAAAELPPS
jgi:exopolyphosphatase/guanosine-5'-triphosphate,3'-diphosphate pyrophosphatase